MFDKDEPLREYVVRYEAERREEGVLAGRCVGGLERYLVMGAREVPEQKVDWPDPLPRWGAACFLQFDPPLPEWTMHIGWGEQRTFKSRCLLFNRLGYPVMRGAATRLVTFEGFESISVGKSDHERVYEQCARMRFESEFRFPWGSRLTLTEHVWLAKGFGEVRRMQHLGGIVLYFPVEGAFEKTLIEVRKSSINHVPTSSGSHEHSYDGAWIRCGVFLDRVFPRPRLDGLVVDYQQLAASE